VRSGNWHGNDTCWRMVLDLNKCLFAFDGSAQARKKPLRYLAVVDGIIAGEGNGPMTPDAKPCGLILAGTNPLAVDSVCAGMMGFDRKKLRMLEGAFAMEEKSFATFTAEDIQIVSNVPAWQGPLDALQSPFAFKPHFGWVGAIEKRD